MINSRSLDLLDKGFKHKVLRWLELCSAAGLDILVVCTLRDNEYQDFLYAKGRTAAGKICTYAKGGQSKHNFGKALDFCIMDGKQCDWNDIQGFTKAGLIAEQIGLAWAGRWNGKIKELGHIEAV